MSIGDRIKQRRKQLGMSAETLAEKIGKSAATVYRYEKGDIAKVDSEIIMPIAEALETSPAYLMGWDSDSLQKKIDQIRSIATPTAKSLQRTGKLLGIYVPKDESENDLVRIYRSLNDLGRQTLIGTARSLATNPDMK